VTDIVQQLRDRAYSGKAVDTLCERAADEIERLRNGAVDGCETVRLTDEERDVLHGVAEDASYRCADFTERVVRGLLERLK
jgi:hypothetical protein